MLLCSAVRNQGIGEVWDAVVEHRDALESSGELAAHRGQQAVRWLWAEVTDTLLDEFRTHPAISESLTELEQAVASGQVSPLSAARQLLDRASDPG